MRSPVYILVVLLCCLRFSALAAQPVDSYFKQLSPEVVEMEVYAEGANPSFVEMGFADYKVRNREECKLLSELEVVAVDLVFTRYPHSLQDWEMNYDTLMERRFAELEQLAPQAFSRGAVQWRVVLQTACSNLTEAKALFHGFVVYGAERIGEEEIEVVTELRYDSLELAENLEHAFALIEGRDSFYDSTVLDILEAHPEWRNMVVVLDWTASMYRHGAQALHALENDGNPDRTLGFVLFNDGDGKWDQDKVVGETGGVYCAAAGKMDSIRKAVVKATMGGSGGDHRENDLEAVLAALDVFPEAQEIILIADNTGPVRDLALLELIDRPVQIILTGVYHHNIQADYFTIAYHTGSPLHTRDSSYVDIPSLLVHDRFQMGDYTYILRGKRFVKQKTN